MRSRSTTVHRLRIGLGIGCALFFGGCAWIPKGDPPAEYLEPPEMTETLAEVTSRLQQWPEDRWWEQFGNPELNELIETALKDNPGLKQAVCTTASSGSACEGRRRAALAVPGSRRIAHL